MFGLQSLLIEVLAVNDGVEVFDRLHQPVEASGDHVNLWLTRDAGQRVARQPEIFQRAVRRVGVEFERAIFSHVADDPGAARAPCRSG